LTCLVADITVQKQCHDFHRTSRCAIEQTLLFAIPKASDLEAKE
jgi:hypothetical protein